MMKAKLCQILIKTNDDLTMVVDKLQQERENFDLLESQLNEQRHNIKMLSKEAKELDKLITVGRTSYTNY